MSKKFGHSRRSRRRDFWQAWREEMAQRWPEQDFPDVPPEQSFPHAPPHPPFPPHFPPIPPRKKAHFWREFFHDFMGTWPEDHWAFGGRRFNPWHQGQDDFNPLVASLLSKGGGLLPLYVLHLLYQQPRYGNEIMELITSRTSGQWVANPGAIYPLMTILEEEELIEGEWEDPRKRTVRIYKLTETGQQELFRLKAIVRPKLQEAIQVLQELAGDLNGDEYI